VALCQLRLQLQAANLLCAGGWQARENTKQQSRHCTAKQNVTSCKAACGALSVWTAASSSVVLSAGGWPASENTKQQSRHCTAKQNVTSCKAACGTVSTWTAASSSRSSVCRWLASKGKYEAAEQALRSLRGPNQIEADLAEMQAAAEEESKACSWALLRSPAVRGELQVGQSLKPVVVSNVVCRAPMVRCFEQSM